MNLKKFNKLNAAIGKAGMLPTISFSLRGTIRFNMAAVELLGLKKDTPIEILQDTDEPIDWYIHIPTKKEDIENAFKTHTFKGKKEVQINSKILAEEFLESIDEAETKRARINTQPNEQGYYAILTAGI